MSPGGVDFGQNGLYNLHIARDGEFKTGMTLVFSFKAENVAVSKIDAPNEVIGAINLDRIAAQ